MVTRANCVGDTHHDFRKRCRTGSDDVLGAIQACVRFAVHLYRATQLTRLVATWQKINVYFTPLLCLWHTDIVLT